MKTNTRTIAFNAIIAAIYAALTILLAPISYGNIQMRISELLVFLAFYNKKYIPGLTIGCFIANLASPLGLWDICFGTLATFIALMAMSKLNNRYLGALAGSVVNGVVVGCELTIVYKTPFLLNAFSVFLGELIVLLIGAVVFGLLEKNKQFIHLIETV